MDDEAGRVDGAGSRGTDPALPGTADRAAPPNRLDAAPAPVGDDEAVAFVILGGTAPAETRSPIQTTCPFFRAVDARGGLVPPIERPDPANRCAAFGAPRPQSARQQQLVCLTAAHETCPRYLRGALIVAEPVVARPVRRGPSTPVAAAGLVLVAALAASFGFVLTRGGFALPSGVPSSARPSEIAVASPAASPTVAITPTLRPTIVPTPSPRPTVTATPTAAPTPGPTPAPPAPTPGSTSSRYALLEPCPDAPNCWIYTVRPGDNLQSIANYFGVPYATVLTMNPLIDDPATIRAGDEIRLPPPTR